MLTKKRLLLSCFLIFVTSCASFLYRIDSPAVHVFDEKPYLADAKGLLNSNFTVYKNHPPLMREIVAIGIAVFGDRPLGWRVMPVLFGSLTLVVMYLWALALFYHPKHVAAAESAAWIAVLATLLNQLHFVHSRVAMLEVFCFAFSAAGLACFCASLNTHISLKSKKALIPICGILMGLSVACKWTGALSLAVIVIYSFIFKNRLYEARYKTLIAWLLIVPVLVYFLTFLPFIMWGSESVLDIVRLQFQILKGHSGFAAEHSYSSSPWGWPLLLNPVWYCMEKSADRSSAQFVFFQGNPVILWTGLIALGFCLKRIFAGSRVAYLIAIVFFANYLVWIISERKTQFFYYYYPSAMTLSLALGFLYVAWLMKYPALIRRTILGMFFSLSFGVFIFFYPLLAGNDIKASELHKWMWFDSWQLKSGTSEPVLKYIQKK